VARGVATVSASLDRDKAAKELAALDDPANLTTITEMIGAVVIASLLGGGGIALLMHGPVGWIIGLLIGLGVVIVTEESAKKQIKKLEIPHLVRSVILSDAKIEAKCEEVATTLAKTLSDDLASNEKLFADLAEQIRTQVQEVLRARADEATILIR
jgi:hypothetical protein